MTILIFFVAASVVFLIGDAIMLTFVMRPLFQSHLGDQMVDSLRLFPGILFYLIHMAGLTWFAARPALAEAAPNAAFLNGAILGLVAYACYELTSWTIMKNWGPALVVTDVVWGTLISGLAAYIGVRAAMAWG
jgi:uncharacterized membrane protein